MLLDNFISRLQFIRTALQICICKLLSCLSKLETLKNRFVSTKVKRASPFLTISVRFIWQRQITQIQVHY